MDEVSSSTSQNGLMVNTKLATTPTKQSLMQSSPDYDALPPLPVSSLPKSFMGVNVYGNSDMEENIPTTDGVVIIKTTWMSSKLKKNKTKQGTDKDIDTEWR